MSECSHEKNMVWELDPANECGWRCDDCQEKPGEPPGFSPRHDRAFLEEKVSSILFWMSESRLISVSNSDHGAEIIEKATRSCRIGDVYDSLSIARNILQFRMHASVREDHVSYWRRISEGVLSGKDMRDRCECGALATSFLCGGGGRPSKRSCQKCHSKDMMLISSISGPLK